MSDGEQDYAAWRAEQHRRAQANAFGWAERASAEYGRATQHEDDARRNGASAYMRDAVADDRRLAQFHGVRSTEALKLAEMWARVAHALTDGNLPEPLLLAGGEEPEQHASLTDTYADPSIVGRAHSG